MWRSLAADPRGLRLPGRHAYADIRSRLYEASSTLGGQARYGALARGRQDFAEPVRFLAREMDRLGVAIQLNTRVDPDFLEQVDADVIVVATGARPASSPFPVAAERTSNRPLRT